MPTIDLNCDLGEGAAFDADLLALVTTANVCCGGHAGGPLTSLRTLRACGELGVAAVAHPGYADRDHFGRRELHPPADEVFALVVSQVGGLAALAAAAGVAVRAVKPHGALYNQACRDAAVAGPVVDAAAALGLPLVGLPGSALEAACVGRVPFVPEGFADRRYRPDGSLTPRSEPDALVHDPGEAVRQVAALLGRGVRTVCVHGDNPQALEFVRRLRESLAAAGVAVAPAV